MEIREITDNLTGRVDSLSFTEIHEAMRLLQEMEKVIS
jgi:hypothetical protein